MLFRTGMPLVRLLRDLVVKVIVSTDLACLFGNERVAERHELRDGVVDDGERVGSRAPAGAVLLDPLPEGPRRDVVLSAELLLRQGRVHPLPRQAGACLVVEGHAQ